MTDAATAPLFRVDDLHVRPADPDAQAATREILMGVDLEVLPGEVHAIMGPNGSGKSTFASTLMGSPDYEVTAGSITFRGDDVTEWSVDERAKAGMFLTFQDPQEVAGVSVSQFLQAALSARKSAELSVSELRLATTEWMKRLGMNSSLVDRSLNEGFSVGEMKRNEIVQMAILEPDLAILDGIDSGLDLEALHIVAQHINDMRAARESMGVILITHDRRLLDAVEPDHVHIFVDGHIIERGGMELAEQFERHGHESFRVGAVA